MELHVRATTLVLVLGLLPLTAAAVESPAKEQCRQQERQEGKAETTAKLNCAVKALFQSRIRRRASEEPVEMTVGSPPMRSEDSETPGDGNWEINVGMSTDWAHGGHRIEAPVLDVNYGRGERVQLTYELPYVFLREPGASPGTSERANGVGDSTFGIKYRFYDNDATGVSFAVYPQVRFRTPGADRDVSEGGTTLILPLILVSEFESFSLTANLGLEARSNQRRVFASFGAGRRLSNDWALLGEVYGSDLNASDEKRVLLNIGLRRKISETQSLSGSLGRDIHVGGDAPKENHFTLTYQKLFGK